MLGNPKNTVQILAEPSEIVALTKHSTVQSMDAALDVWAEWERHGHKTGVVEYDLQLLLSAIYDAGRVQGIREERRRRRKLNS